MPEIRYYRDPKLPFFEIKSCRSGVHASRKHAHEEFSVGVVLSGSSLVKGAGKDFSVGNGSVIIIPPGMIHQCSPKDLTKWQFQMLYLKKSWLFSWLDTIPKNLTIAAKSLNTEDYSRLVRLFQMLREEITPLEKEAFLITGLTYFFDFESYFQQKLLTTQLETVSVQAARNYLQANFLEKITLDDLAVISNMSKYHLLRYFKKVCQTSPHAYQTMLRINYAKQKLIKQKDLPITMIAQEAGFFDQSHFVKTFKQYYGTTPFEYRLG